MSLSEDALIFGEQDDEGIVFMLLGEARFLGLFDTLTSLRLKQSIWRQTEVGACVLSSMGVHSCSLTHSNRTLSRK